MATRAGIVVTGTEVLTGRVIDRNGPWLAEQLRVYGVDIAHVTVVGDRPEDLRDALRFAAESGVDVIITSGGLGPTADDLTAEVVAGEWGRPMRLDADLERQIAAIVERLSANFGWPPDPEATAAGIRKQAMVPDGSTVVAPVGTAPGLVIPVGPGRSGPPVVVLPGPPRELQGMWPAALETEVVQTALARRAELRQSTIRLWGIRESELAATLREQGDALDGLEITTCLREGEVEIVTRYGVAAQPAYDRLHAVLAQAYAATAFSLDGATIDEVVAHALLAKQLTVATAESCTAGLLAGRLTDLAGSSAYVLGGLVVYSNAAKHTLAGVPTELIERVGAVSPEVALSLAEGARDRLGTDIGIGITGIAGPGGGSADKPVGLVYLGVSGLGQTVVRKLNLPGSRADVRQRTVVIALHLLRELLIPLEAT